MTKISKIIDSLNANIVQAIHLHEEKAMRKNNASTYDIVAKQKEIDDELDKSIITERMEKFVKFFYTCKKQESDRDNNSPDFNVDEVKDELTSIFESIKSLNILSNSKELLELKFEVPYVIGMTRDPNNQTENMYKSFINVIYYFHRNSEVWWNDKIDEIFTFYYENKIEVPKSLPMFELYLSSKRMSLESKINIINNTESEEFTPDAIIKIYEKLFEQKRTDSNEKIVNLLREKIHEKFEKNEFDNDPFASNKIYSIDEFNAVYNEDIEAYHGAKKLSINAYCNKNYPNPNVNNVNEYIGMKSRLYKDVELAIIGNRYEIIKHIFESIAGLQFQNIYYDHVHEHTVPNALIIHLFELAIKNNSKEVLELIFNKNEEIRKLFTDKIFEKQVYNEGKIEDKRILYQAKFLNNAMLFGNDDIVYFLLPHIRYFDQVNNLCMISKAIQYGYYDVADEIIEEAKFDINQIFPYEEAVFRNSTDFTSIQGLNILMEILHIPNKNDLTSQLEYLKTKNFDFAGVSKKSSPNDNWSKVRFGNGPTYNTSRHRGENLIFYAIYFERFDVCEWLINNTELKLDSRNPEGKTVFQVIMEESPWPLVKQIDYLFKKHQEGVDIGLGDLSKEEIEELSNIYLNYYTEQKDRFAQIEADLEKNKMNFKDFKEALRKHFGFTLYHDRFLKLNRAIVLEHYESYKNLESMCNSIRQEFIETPSKTQEEKTHVEKLVEKSLPGIER